MPTKPKQSQTNRRVIMRKLKDIFAGIVAGARSITMFPPANYRLPSKTATTDDVSALAKDWKNVGDDMRKVIGEHYGDKHE